MINYNATTDAANGAFLIWRAILRVLVECFDPGESLPTAPTSILALT